MIQAHIEKSDVVVIIITGPTDLENGLLPFPTLLPTCDLTNINELKSISGYIRMINYKVSRLPGGTYLFLKLLFFIF